MRFYQAGGIWATGDEKYETWGDWYKKHRLFLMNPANRIMNFLRGTFDPDHDWIVCEEQGGQLNSHNIVSRGELGH